MSKFIIFDLDGTLADCSHRLPLLPDWDAFYANCGDDKPIPQIVEVYGQFIDSVFPVEIWSGRRESERETTIDWFDRHNIPLPGALRMRPNGDKRPDTVLKGEWLDGCGFVPWLVFEDRTSVVGLYRSRGIRVCQVAPGNF